MLTTAEAGDRLGADEKLRQRRQSWAKKLQERRQAWREQGLCTRCGSERQPGKKTCLKHAKEGAQRSQTRREKDPELERQKDKVRREDLRLRAITKFGGRCACCGESEIKFLAIDHIHGNKHPIHQKNLGRWWYRKLLREGTRDDFQVLCHNCNMAKGFYGICPHQEQRNANDKTGG